MVNAKKTPIVDSDVEDYLATKKFETITKRIRPLFFTAKCKFFGV